MRVGYSNDLNGPALKLRRPMGVVEHNNTVILQSVRHGVFAIVVIMISKDSEPTERSFEARKDGRDCPWWHAPTAEYLHIDVITPEQREVRHEVRGFINNQLETRYIVRMRAGVKI